jgi:hypothetical protein
LQAWLVTHERGNGAAQKRMALKYTRVLGAIHDGRPRPRRSSIQSRASSCDELRVNVPSRS